MPRDGMMRRRTKELLPDRDPVSSDQTNYSPWFTMDDKSVHHLQLAIALR
jgi:hypothetical protein